MENFQLEHNSWQWMLVTLSSKVGLNTVLLHNGNNVPYIPLVQAVHMTETHEHLQVLLQNIRYKEHLCNTCADINVIAMWLCCKAGTLNSAAFNVKGSANT
jgi:hypothetical protein